MKTNRAGAQGLLLGRPYLGLVGSDDGAGGGGRTEGDVVSLNARLSLKMVCGELQRGSRAEVCVRMQNKGWVAGMRSSEALCFCLVDQPKATLADAQTFLTRICNRCDDAY
ncbi:hypothetical protein LPJ75_007070 [Coemansia sp. RSA 2598]|nr:hypothetical protein LPJ75_007070 [Coemansia sp. RSA 2598]